MTIDPLVQALQYAADPPGSVPMTKLATVTGVVASGVQLRFDGEAVTSSRTYRAAGGCRVGDRVLCTRVGSVWVVTGAVGAAAEVPLLRVDGSITPSVNPNPNDNVLRTVFIRTSVAAVPAGATTALVSLSASSASTVNAACFWTPLFSLDNGTSTWEVLLFGQLAHNNTQPLVDTGFSVTAEFDVRHLAVGQQVAIAANQSVSGGGGSMWHGQLLYSVTFRGVKP